MPADYPSQPLCPSSPSSPLRPPSPPTPTHHSPLTTHHSPRNRVLPRAEWDRLLQAAPTARDRALLALMLYAGLRVSELCALDRADLGLPRGRLHVPGPDGRPTAVYLHPIAGEALRAHLATRPHPRPEAGDPLFVSRQGGRLGVRQVASVVRAAGSRAGLGEALNPRLLRRSCAASLLARGAEPEFVRDHLRLCRASVAMRLARKLLLANFPGTAE